MEFVRCIRVFSEEDTGEIVYVNLAYVKVIHREERAERSTLIKTIDGEWYECHDELGADKMNLCIRKFNETNEDDIMNENVEPCKRGKWIICSDGYYPYCSVCRHEPTRGEMTNYCPQCGAKMDKEE